MYLNYRHILLTKTIIYIIKRTFTNFENLNLNKAFRTNVIDKLTKKKCFHIYFLATDVRTKRT